MGENTILSNILLTVDIISFGISGVMLGAWTDGQRQRDYYEAEESKQRNVRLKSSLVFAVIGILSFILVGIIHLL